MKIANGRLFFYQWELNQQLDLTVPCSKVHFENGTLDKALCCEVKELNGKKVCDVPNIFLMTAYPIHAYAWSDDGTFVVAHAVFSVEPRTRPSGYVYTQTEAHTVEKVVQDALGDTVEALDAIIALQEKLINGADVSTIVTPGKIGAVPVTALTPKTHHVVGEIFGSFNGTTRGSGTATIHITPDGVARVDFAVAIFTSGTVSDVFAIGIRGDLLRALNPTIPNITPLSGGICTFYADGGVDLDKTQYGGTHYPDQTLWACGRIYQPDGAFGSWPDCDYLEGMYITGTCYGLVTE